ncbi:hypothetical protein ABXK61_16275 [Burkholderia sola]|uniref:hypothetical protein n=1 Tax=Burkholderia TaxID=32008 RepID=UPI001AE44A84|nr:hypothetical protein [Burkholderia sp. AcTa6-5]MBP0714862.1 hypothetical protein [Burkholderia sp. AcTa6-5]
MTTDNSRADALTRESIEAIGRKYAGAYFTGLLFQDADSFARFSDELILAASPVEQHEAAPASGMELAFSSAAMSRRDELELPGATVYVDRFVDALGLLCRSKPPKELCEQWLNGESDELQSWTIDNRSIYWQTGIGAIEAAQHLADNPEEGEGHEGFTGDYARAAEAREDHECVYENGDGVCRECAALAKAAQPEQPAADERAAFDASAIWHKARNAWMATSRHGTQEDADAAAIAVLNAASASSPNGTGAEERADALYDSAYCAGVQEGFRLGDAGDNEGLRKVLESRAGYVAVLRASRAPRTDVAGGVDELPHWFDMFLTNVCELPDRNSPEGEPDAIVATLDELRNCAVNAIEQCVSYAQPPSADAAAAPADAQAVEAVAISGHDLSTSAGGRGYIAEFFATRLRRHDFDRYINERLAADFACALAQYLRDQDAAPASAPVGLTDAARDVLDERRRQVTAEGWTPGHDDQYTKRELAYAAGLYAMSEMKRGDPPLMWPWDKNWWKPSTERRNLVKAGALILAEIERLDRALLKGDKQ